MGNKLEKIRELNQHAWNLRKNDRQGALELALQAQNLLSDCPKAQPVDEFDCLKTLTYCFDRLGKSADAIPIGLKANLLAEQIGDNFLISTIQGLLGRIYWHIDDFPTSMDYYLSALKLVQSKKHPELELSLINGLGLVHYGLENYSESLSYFMSCLDNAGDDDSTRADANNNIAYVLHTLGRDQEALEFGMDGLSLHRQLGIVGGIMETLHSLGTIHLTLGNHDQAMAFLQEGIEIARQSNSELLEISYILGISRVLQVNGKLDQAEKELLLALQIGRKINSITNISVIHERLAEIYKEEGNFKLALNHFQAYHDTYKIIFNDKSDQRVKNLQILHQVETSRKQADLYRGLAGTDFLTSLANRRGFLEIMENAFRRVKIDKSQLVILMLDIDHFKNVNDLYGHRAGDDVLSSVAASIKKTLRPGDVAGRYGGEEFIVLMLGISSDQSFHIAERIRQTIAQQVIWIDQALVRVTVSIGLASIEFEQALSLDLFIDRADQALYMAKRQGRNRVVAWKQNE